MFRVCYNISRQIVRQNSRWTSENGCRTFSVNISSGCDEVQKAKNAANTSTPTTIFDKIINKQIPVKTLYEDEKCMAFQDIAPQAPVHFLVIPKQRIDMVENVTQNDQNMLGHLMRIAAELGKKEAPNGFRLVVNNGVEGCQSVYHLHIHVLGGRQLNWPPG